METNAIIDYWGVEYLRRWPEEVMEGASIPDASKAFLARVGMPAPGRSIGAWRIDWDLSFPRAPEMPRRRIIAARCGTPIFVEDVGRVIMGSSPALPGSKFDAYPERWFNTSVEQFAYSLTEYDMFFTRAMPYAPLRNDASEKYNIDIFEKRLKEIDSAAIADEASAWSDKIFELRVLK